MNFFKGLPAAFATYSAVPVPRFQWDADTPGLALCWFPAVGVVCGGALCGWYALCRALAAGSALFAAGAVCLPLLLTGGIHMDGFMDTVDAISSHQPREKKLEILKDPHCGAFAVMYCGLWLLLAFGLFTALYTAGTVMAVCPGYVLSRALSVLCAVTLPNARGGGMLFEGTVRLRRAAVTAAMSAVAAIACGGMLCIAPAAGGCAALLALLAVPAYRAAARRLFGGATGDTAGFFLQLCELALLLGAWIAAV